MEEGFKKIRLEDDTITESEKKDYRQKESGDDVLMPKIDLNNEDKPKRRKMKFPKIRRPSKKTLKIAGIVAGVLLVFLTIAGLLTFRVYKQARKVESAAKMLLAASEEQDFGKLKTELQNTKEEVIKLKSTYKTITWLRIVPYLGGFIKDGQHGLNAAVYGIEGAEIVIDTIEPYAGIIGFKSEDNSMDNGETAQNMLDFVIKTIPDIIPKSDELIRKVALVQAEIENIDPDRYPEKFGDLMVREKVKDGVELVNLTSTLLENSKPLLEVAPYLLGSEEERTYMLIFQNDKELRPTGGFITAYSIAKVEKGKFEPVRSDDIYNLDNLYTATIPAPEPIIKYLKGPYLISKRLRLRDMNWSPGSSMTISTGAAIFSRRHWRQ